MSKFELIDYPLTEPRFRYIGRKGIFPQVSNFDADFERLSTTPIIVNNLDLNSDEGWVYFKNLIYSKHDGDVFKNIPTCPCGNLNHGHLTGELCDICGQPCLAPTEQELKPVLWMAGLEPVGYFMNPQVYMQLSDFFSKGGFSVIDYLMDPRYRPPKIDCLGEIAARELKLPIGLKTFRENFDEIMEVLLEGKVRINQGTRTVNFRFADTRSVPMVREYLELVRDRIFVKHLPFPSKIGFVLEESGNKVYGDHEMAPALNALLSMANAASGARRMSLSETESTMSRAVKRLAEYHRKYEDENLFEKYGIFRRLTYGFRPHWTFRTVITSEHGVNKRDELIMPWGVSIMTFKLHVANKLLKRGKTPNAIFSMIYDNTHRYHMTLDNIFNELIEESPDGRGFPVLFTRYPSLKHGSTQRFYVPRIKKDPNDVATSISPLNLVPANADFDGDGRNVKSPFRVI